MLFVRGDRSRPTALLALLVLLMTVPVAGRAAASQATSLRTCGHFFHKHDDVIVSAGATPSCPTAIAIIRAFWSGAGVTMHGGSDADGYFTIAAWPGWRCLQAAGAGVCHKGTATADYAVKGKA